MFYEEIRIKQGLSYISFCPFRILYKSKFILMATSLGTNAVVIMTVHCIYSSLDHSFLLEYGIHPNYHTMRLGFSQLLGKLMVKYVSTYTKGTLKNKRSAKDLSNYAYAMFFILIFFIKAYVVGTHLNCINKSMQFKWVPTTYAIIKK